MDAAGRAPRILLSTAPDPAVAERIARALVERGLAACVNCVPSVRSVYRWKGAVEAADEVLLVLKTTAENVAALETALSELHPYEVPEVVAIAPERVEAKYLAWLQAETRRPDPPRG
jgi:periplasmic divalent cation tolerance protein